MNVDVPVGSGPRGGIYLTVTTISQYLLSGLLGEVVMRIGTVPIVMKIRLLDVSVRIVESRTEDVLDTFLFYGFF